MTQDAVARLIDSALRRYVESAAKASRELREHYELRLAAQERTIASQAGMIADMTGRAARAEARAAAEAERHQQLYDRLVAFIEERASRSFAHQLGL
jgi:hypothetical protein